MFVQSGAMASAFGSYYQYRKRKISSLSNDEFNKLTPESIADMVRQDTQSLERTFQQMSGQMQQLQSTIINELINYVKQLPEDIIGSDAGQAWLEGMEKIMSVPGNQIEKRLAEDSVDLQTLVDKIGNLLPSVKPAFAQVASTVHTTTTPSSIRPAGKQVVDNAKYASRIPPKSSPLWKLAKKKEKPKVDIVAEAERQMQQKLKKGLSKTEIIKLQALQKEFNALYSQYLRMKKLHDRTANANARAIYLKQLNNYQRQLQDIELKAKRINGKPLNYTA